MINIIEEYITVCTVSRKRNYPRYFFTVGTIMKKVEQINSLLNACTLLKTPFNKDIVFNFSSEKNKGKICFHLKNEIKMKRTNLKVIF